MKIDDAVGVLIERRHKRLLDQLNRFIQMHIPRLRGKEAVDALRELDTEFANAVAVLDAHLDSEHDACKELYIELSSYMTLRGYASDEIRWGQVLLRAEMPDDDGMDMDLALLNNFKLITNIAAAYDELGDVETAIQFYTYIVEAIPPNDTLTIVYSNLGVSYRQIGDFDKALQYTNMALAFERELNDRRALSLSLMNLSSIYHGQYRMKEGLEAIKESCAMARELDNPLLIAQTSGQYALMLVSNFKLDEAVPIYEEVVRLYDSIPDPIGAARTRYNLALLSYALNKHQAAIDMATEATALLEPYGFPEVKKMRETLAKWQERYDEYRAWVD